MKRIILSTLIGLIATTGAFATNNSDLANGLNRCLNMYVNDPGIVEFLNNGVANASGDAPFKGMQFMLEGANGRDGQLYSVASSKYETYIDPDVKENRKNLSKAIVGSMLYYVANNCPKYFIAFARQLIDDGTFDPDTEIKLSTPMIWDESTEKIKFVTKEEFDNTPSKNQIHTAIDITNALPSLSSTFYVLALPQGTTKPNEWLTESAAQKALDHGYCDEKVFWNIDGSNTYIINGVHHMSMYEAFPGQLINFDRTQVSVPGTEYYSGKTAINAGQCGSCLVKAKNLSGAVKEVTEKGKDFYSQADAYCDPANYRLYIASRDDPIGITAGFVQRDFGAEPPPEEEDEWYIRAAKDVKWPAVFSGISGILWGGTYGVASSFAKAAGTTVAGATEALTAATAAGTATFSMKAASGLSRAANFMKGATVGMLMVTGITAILSVTFDGLTSDMKPVTVQGYNQLYIMYELDPADVDSNNITVNPINDSNVLHIKKSSTSNTQPAPDPVQSGDNAGTPAKEKTYEQQVKDVRHKMIMDADI